MRNKIPALEGWATQPYMILPYCGEAESAYLAGAGAAVVQHTASWSGVGGMSVREQDATDGNDVADENDTTSCGERPASL